MKKRRTRREISDREIQEWQDLRDYGFKGSEIAEIYGRSRRSIYTLTLNKPRVYMVYNREGSCVAAGRIEEIAKQLGIKRISAMAMRCPSYKGGAYTISEVGVDE